jgi:hypothetical protein
MSPEVPPADPATQKERLDYAWNWFNFHAEQRTKMFNYMLLGLGILATAIATTLQKGQALAAMGLSIAAVLLCVAFGRMDRRNRDLYKLGQDVLSGIEDKHLFATTEKGLAKEVDRQNSELEKARWPVDELWTGGHHRFWMPFVIWTFGAVFVAALLLAYDMHRRPDAYPSADKTIVVCCQDVAGSRPAGSDAGKPGHSVTGTNVTVDGAGTISGWRWLTVGAGLLLVAVGVPLLISGKSRLSGGALVASGIAAAALPNLSVPLHAEFRIDPSVDFKLLPEDLKITIERLLKGQAQSALLESGPFVGFGEGLETFQCGDTTNAETASKIKSALGLARARGLQPLLLLVGSTDRTPLSPALRARFESNTGLARARVAAAEKCLGLDPQDPGVIRLVSGPAYTLGTRDSPKVAEGQMAKDRAVRVFLVALQTKGDDPQPRPLGESPR